VARVFEPKAGAAVGDGEAANREAELLRRSGSSGASDENATSHGQSRAFHLDAQAVRAAAGLSLQRLLRSGCNEPRATRDDIDGRSRER
jgi:hypothetical protein